MVITGIDPVDVPPKKKIKQEEKPSVSDSTSEKIWLRAFGCYLTVSDKYIFQNKEQLNDRHIDFAERILLNQFPGVGGLGCTLFQKKAPAEKIKNGIHIIHDRGNHWIVASTISCTRNTVKIYDSIYNSVEEETKGVVMNLFHLSDDPNFQVVETQKQVGSEDCGLFAIATTTAILFGVCMTGIEFNQHQMRLHCMKCFDRQIFSLFPTA